MTKPALLIIGAGGFGRTVAEAAMLTGEWGSADFVEDSYPEYKLPSGYHVVGHSDNLADLLPAYTGVVVAMAVESDLTYVSINVRASRKL